MQPGEGNLRKSTRDELVPSAVTAKVKELPGTANCVQAGVGDRGWPMKLPCCLLLEVSPPITNRLVVWFVSCDTWLLQEGRDSHSTQRAGCTIIRSKLHCAWGMKKAALMTIYRYLTVAPWPDTSQPLHSVHPTRKKSSLSRPQRSPAVSHKQLKPNAGWKAYKA